MIEKFKKASNVRLEKWINVAVNILYERGYRVDIDYLRMKK